MAKSSGKGSTGGAGGRGGQRGGQGGKGGGWPSKTGKPSGGGRSNAPPRGKR